MLFSRIRYYFRIRKDCPHPEHRIACTHTGEITRVGGYQSQCLECYKYFYELPDICSNTRETHNR